MTPAEVNQLVERLEKMFQTAVDRAENCRDNECFQDAIDYEIEARDVSRAASALTLLAQEREELREAAMIGRNTALAIQKATLEGRVRNDVAWFSEIETLNDFCASAIENIDNHIARSAPEDT